MEDISPEQKEQLLTWSIQRDALLRDIAILKEQKGKIIQKYQDDGEELPRLDDKETVELLDKKKSLIIEINDLEKDKKKLEEENKKKEEYLSDISVIKRDYEQLLKQKTELSDLILTKDEQGEKDTWLKQLAVLKDEGAKLEKKNKELAISNTEISNKILVSLGRMEELNEKEKEYMNLMGVEVSQLEVSKTQLQTLIPVLEKEVVTLENKKESLTKDIMFLITTHEDVFKRTGALEQIIENVTRISKLNMKELEESVGQIKNKTSEILSLSTKDMEAHQRIMGEIPKVFVELQRKSLIRRKI